MKKMIWKLAFLLLFALIAFVFYLVRIHFPRSVGPYQGNYTVSGIRYPVDVYFDEKGIPQIFSRTDRDAFFALGWLHATERLFQMEIVYRLSVGELSSIFGKELVSMDTTIRKNRFRAIAHEQITTLPDSVLTLLRAYTEGINARIALDQPLPPEFTILNLTPRTWKPEDCLSIYLFQTWFSHALMDHDIPFIEMRNKLGAVMDSLVDVYFPWSPSTIPAASSLPAMASMALASNSAVIHSGRSMSNHALHESDPHLIVNQIPNFWYIAGIHSDEGYRFVGVTLPGLPFGVMGHNGSIAFSFTVASIDIIDYYLFPFAPDDSSHVRTWKGVLPVTFYRDTLLVRGGKPLPFTYAWIDRLPVWQKTDSGFIAYRWAGFDQPLAAGMTRAYQLGKARDFDTFRKCVTSLGALDANWMYSDRVGNIGYQLGTPVPVRTSPTTHFLLDGSNPDHQWKGYLPLEETPHVFNPAKGWLATCNNQIVDEPEIRKIPGFYDPYRIIRAGEILERDQRLTTMDLLDFQKDLISGRFVAWKELLMASIDTIPDEMLRTKLKTWDGFMGYSKREEAYLFSYWWHWLPKHLLEDELGDDWEKGRYLLNAILQKQPPSLIDDRRTPEKESLTTISKRALVEAYHQFSDNHDDHYSYLIIQHPLGRITILDYFLRLNRGPFYNFGDGGTLNANWVEYHKKRKRLETIVGPSMRFLMDWANPDLFSIYTNLGQSGNPYSPYYDAFLPIWQKAGMWIVPFSKDLINNQKSSLLSLKPNGGTK